MLLNDSSLSLSTVCNILGIIYILSLSLSRALAAQNLKSFPFFVSGENSLHVSNSLTISLSHHKAFHQSNRLLVHHQISSNLIFSL